MYQDSTLGEWIKFLFFIGILGGIGYLYFQEDDRPDRVKWVTDVRNGCEVKDRMLLANEPVHLGKGDYTQKVLTIYNCKGGQTAALIHKQEDTY
jgi:hypothetical protein